MTIDATVERSDDVGAVTGVVDELIARVAALGDAQSGPGPPDASTVRAVVIAGQRVELGPSRCSSDARHRCSASITRRSRAATSACSSSTVW